MTQWAEETGGGRKRGPRAIGRAWVELLVRPREFFRNGIAPGDQAPGLVFAALVVLLEEASRVAVVKLALPTGPFPYPSIGSFTPGVTVLALLAIIIFVVPATVHLTAAIQTLLLVPVADERGGISETVQLMCYSMAPCVLAGLPFPEVRLAVTAWGAGMYILGTSVVHRIRIPVASLVGALPAAILFGYGFRGFAAVQMLVSGF